MEDKVERFKKAVEYFSAASKPRSPSLGPSPFICELKELYSFTVELTT